MSIEAFLDLIRQRFSSAEGKLILEALTQDPLVWQFVKDEEHSLPYFNTTADEIEAFTPGSIALWLIEKEMGISLPSAEDLSQAMPDPVRQRAAKAFQTVINTGLPPTNLHDAGLLALTLRERRLIKGSWQGISEELFKSQHPSLATKH